MNPEVTPASHMLLQERVLVRSAHTVITIRGADADVTDMEALQRSTSDVVASSGYQLYISTIQQVIKVAVEIRVWDRPPSEGWKAEGWTRSAPMTLELPTKVLLVEETDGEIPVTWSLRAPGVYRIHPSWRNREIAQQRLFHLLETCGPDGRPLDLDCFVRGRQALEGLEEYRLDLWLREAEFSPDGG